MTVLEKQLTSTSANKVMSKAEGDVYDIAQDRLSDFDNDTYQLEEKKVLRKIDLCLLPLLICSYALQFLDKQTLNFASVMGLIQDLNLKGTDYAWSGSIFYFGYLAFSYPASYAMVRLPLAKYLAGTCVVWATCLCCHAATNNFTSLMIVRFFLGAAEASISPGFGLITGMWYTREEQPFRCGIWFFGNSIAVMCGSLLGYAIAHIQGGIGPWRWLFIIFGIITLAWAGVLFWRLPDTQQNARWLNEREKKVAINRIRSNRTGLKENTWKWSQAFEAMTDIRVWLIVLFQLSIAIPNGAITTFNSLVISGLGFTKLQVYLLQIPTGVVHGTAALLSTYLCSKLKNARCMISVVLAVISLVGSILVKFAPNVGGQLFGLFIFIVYAAGIPISLSLISSNVAGFTKKAVASAMMFVAYCVGNIIGPFLFFPSEAKINYPSGFLATSLCFGFAIIFMTALRFVLSWENKRRDKLQQGMRRPSDVDMNSGVPILTDETDKQNLNFRYML